MGLWHSVSKKCFNPSDYILSSKNDNINTKFPNSSYEVTKMDRQENENKAEDTEYTVVKATRSNTNRDNIYLAVPSTSRDTKVDTNRNTTSTKRKTTKPNILNDALLKTHKSLNCFTNFTSNFRRLNPKPLTSVPKRSKNIRIDTCDIQSKKKQSNWMLRFNCTKSKHGKTSKNHESSTDPKHCTLKHYFKGSSSDICNAESDCDKNPEVNNKPGCSRLKTNDNFIVVYKCSSLNNIPNEALYNDMEAGFDESSMDGAHQGCSSATESFYGSISDINNQFDTSFDLAKLSSKNINVVSGSLVHPLSCVKLVCPFQETDPRGCIQLVCPTDNVKKVCCCNNSNSARTSSTSNLPQTSTTSSEQPTTDTQNKSEPGSDCLLQLVWRTDLNVESLRVLLASHCNVDGVMSGRCHTQVDYMHYLVPELSNITACSFYWGKMDRYEAERLLDGRPEGTFLLRDSAQEEFLFSVSFRKYGRSLHARIEQWNHRFSFDSHDPGVFAADTVCGLIEHYKDPTCCLFFEPMLTRPLHRVQPFSLQHLCRATIADRLRYDDIDILRLPSSLRTYLKEYHYRQRVRVKRFDSSQLQWVELNT